MPAHSSSLALMLPVIWESSLTVTVPVVLTSPLREQLMSFRLPAVTLLWMVERRVTVPVVMISPLKAPAISMSPSERRVPSRDVPAAR